LDSPTTLIANPALSTEALNDLIIDSIQDIKGKRILKLDLRKIPDSPADFFIICEGDSTTQVRAIADNVERRVKYEGFLRPATKEGERNARWICIDYYNIVVHVFHRETRSFYELEDLWSDAIFTEYESL
jgi:ribosome-associated protein